MKVYVAIAIVEYEFEDIIGVFKDKDKATRKVKKFVEENESYDDYRVEEWEVK